MSDDRPAVMIKPGPRGIGSHVYQPGITPPAGDSVGSQLTCERGAPPEERGMEGVPVQQERRIRQLVGIWSESPDKFERWARREIFTQLAKVAYQARHSEDAIVSAKASAEFQRMVMPFLGRKK